MVRRVIPLVILGSLVSCGESGQAHLAPPRKRAGPYETYLSIVTKESLSYNLPLRGFDDHVEMVVGPGQAPQLHFYEAQNEQAANIHPGDFFVATDTINGYTRILEYSGIDSQHNELWLWDLAGSTTDKVPYNPITGTASHPIAGIPRRIVLSLQNVLAIDQDGNGIIDGKQSKIECIDRVISQEDLRPR